MTETTDVNPMTLLWYVHGRRPTDFAILDEWLDSGDDAHEMARRLYAAGYNVTVTIEVRRPVAVWKQEERT